METRIRILLLPKGFFVIMPFIFIILINFVGYIIS
jgi:hypothetical protein